jgi:hypothetical protein
VNLFRRRRKMRPTGGHDDVFGMHAETLRGPLAEVKVRPARIGAASEYPARSNLAVQILCALPRRISGVVRCLQTPQIGPAGSRTTCSAQVLRSHVWQRQRGIA